MSTHEIPVYRRLDVEVVSGSGVLVRTRDGRELLDFYGGHAVAALGYGDAALCTALQDQATHLFFQTNLVSVEVRERAHAALADFAPPGLDHVFLVNSGAEANENALRIAFRATGRSHVVALRGGFHGRTAAAGACTDGNKAWYGFPQAPFPVRRVAPDDVRALDAALDANSAALILEPVQGIAGARALSSEFLRWAREACTARGVVLIADEVQCGMGRCGTPFAIDYAGVIPDIITVAKGLAGGFPAGAVIATEAVTRFLGVGDLGTTFGGGPMASRLICHMIATLPEFQENVRQREEQIRATCRVGPVVDIQGRGLLLGLRTRRPARQVLSQLLHCGVLAGEASDPSIVRLTPPLIIDDTHVATLARALASLGDS